MLTFTIGSKVTLEAFFAFFSYTQVVDYLLSRSSSLFYCTNDIAKRRKNVPSNQ